MTMRRYSRDEWAQVFNHVLGTRLPGAPVQDILEEVTVPRYTIGSRLELPAPDGRVFHYCHATPLVGAMAQFGCFARSDRVFEGDGAQPAIPINSLQVTMTTAEVILAHELDGGMFGGLTDRGVYQIESQPVAATGANVVLNLARRTYRAMGGGANRLYAYPNIYSQVACPDIAMAHLNGYATVVGIPLIPITADNYFWALTWGAMFMISGTWSGGGAAPNGVGGNVNEREIAFDWDGAIVYRGVANDIDKWMQRAGYVMWDGREATGGDQYVMVQLAP